MYEHFSKKYFLSIFIALNIIGYCQTYANYVNFCQRHKVQQLTVPLQHAEGPHWDAEKQLLYFVDISGNRVYQYDPYAKKLTYADIGDVVGVAIPLSNTQNKFLIGKGTSLAVLTWNGENTTSPPIQILTSVDLDKPGNRFNDGKSDAIGRFWIGTMGLEKPIGTVAPNRGTLYRLSNSTSCRLEPIITGVSISNGLAWSLDNQYMYYIDSPTRRVEKFDYNLHTGDISNRQTLVDFQKENIAGAPDGMTIDNNGNLWIACWGGSQIVNIHGKTGKLLYSIPMPVERVTSLTFGGTYYDILFVTTMRTGLTPAQLQNQPAAGAVFSISNLPVMGRYNTPVAGCINSY